MTTDIASIVHAINVASDTLLRTPVALTGSDIDLLLAALNTHQTSLCESWERATDRGRRAEAEELNRRMHRVDQVAATLRDARKPS